MPNSQVVRVEVDEVIADRRKVYEQTGDPTHLEYEKKFQAELRKRGRQNPEIKHNYYLEDIVEEGNFVSRERLLLAARPKDKVVPLDRLYVGIDWARRGDHTWLTVCNFEGDIIEWFKYPHVPYLEQVQMIRGDMEADRSGWRYCDRVLGVFGDSTAGSGDAPMEMLAHHSGLPVGDESHFVFTAQSKDELYVNFEEKLFSDPPRFSYPADHFLTSEFEEQMIGLLREYIRDGELLSVHHPDEPDAHDDAPDSTALALLAAKEGFVGEIVIP